MFYLARWKVDDTEGLDDLIPDLGPDTHDLTFAAVDVRGQGDREAGRPGDAANRGWALCWVEQDIPTVRNRIIRLGDHPDDVSVTAKNRMMDRLGWNPERGLLPNRLGDLIYEFVKDEGDDADPSRHNVLRPNSRGLYQVRMGPHIMKSEPVLASLSAAYTDDFNRSDEALESGADWSDTNSGPGLDVVSNQVEHASSSGVQYVIYDGGEADGDTQYCEIDAVSTGYQQLGPQVRMLNSAANSSGYMCYWQGDSANLCRIRYTNTNASPGRTTLASNTSVTENTPTVRIEVDGSDLEAFIDGSSKVTTTDTTYGAASTRRSGGLYMYSGSQQADNWGFGDIVTSQTIAPSSVASGKSVATPTVQLGPQSLTVNSAVTRTKSIPTPTVLEQKILTVNSAVSRTKSIPTPTVELGPQQLVVGSAVASGKAIASPSVTQAGSITPSALTSSKAVSGVASVLNSHVIVVGSAVTSSKAVTSPSSISQAAQDLIVGSAIGSLKTVLTPTVANSRRILVNSTVSSSRSLANTPAVKNTLVPTHPVNRVKRSPVAGRRKRYQRPHPG